jgi:hypothetical protein
VSRYVGELIKMRETFIEPLLHPFQTPTTPHLDDDAFPRPDSPAESMEPLPIASRFMSPTGFRPESPTSPAPRRDDKDTPNIDGESLDTDEEDEHDDRLGRVYFNKRPSADARESAKHNHPRSPYRGTANKPPGTKNIPFPSRSHHSLPPPARMNPSASTHSLGRQSGLFEQHSSTPTPGSGSRVLRKFRKSTTTPDVLAANAVPPHQLPEDLRICLEVVESGILDGHVRLSEGLRKRYDEQYPLVRSLADVFVSNVS